MQGQKCCCQVPLLVLASINETILMTLAASFLLLSCHVFNSLPHLDEGNWATDYFMMLLLSQSGNRMHLVRSLRCGLQAAHLQWHVISSTGMFCQGLRAFSHRADSLSIVPCLSSLPPQHCCGYSSCWCEDFRPGVSAPAVSRMVRACTICVQGTLFGLT